MRLEIVLRLPATERWCSLRQTKDTIDLFRWQAVLFFDQKPRKGTDTVLVSAHADLIRDSVALQVNDVPVRPVLLHNCSPIEIGRRVLVVLCTLARLAVFAFYHEPI